MCSSQCSQCHFFMSGASNSAEWRHSMALSAASTSLALAVAPNMVPRCSMSGEGWSEPGKLGMPLGSFQLPTRW